MKHLISVILLVGLVVAIPIASCASPSEPKPFPPPEGYSSWDEYHEEYQRQTGSPQPTPSQETETNTEVEPLEYEAQSYVKRAHHNAEFILSTVGFSKDLEAIQAALQEAYSIPEYYPVGHVSVRNTDKIRGAFKVEIVFHSDDEEYREAFTLELEPGQVGEVEKSANIHYDNDEWSFQYEVIPDTKPIEK